MVDTTLTLDTNRPTGSRSSRRLRRDDVIPGVVYGYDTEPTPVSVNRRLLRQALTTDAGLNALLTLELGGDSKLAVVRDLQRDPVKSKILHVDFLAVDPNAEFAVDVKIVLIGESEKVENADGGTIDQSLHSINVNTKPTNIPSEITFDVSDLDIGDTVRIADLVMPEGVTANADPEETVASAKIITIAPEPSPEDELEAGDVEATEEGGGDGEASADGGDEGDSSDDG